MDDKPKRSPAENKILRDFAARLEKACDDSPHIPEKGKGRQVVIADMLGVSQEAARKYFAGLSLPRPVKMQLLAEKLDVDKSWLALGERPEMPRDAKKLAGRVAEGSVLMVAGTIQIAGGKVAFPSPDDRRSSYVDMYAIIGGHKLDIHVSNGRLVAPSKLEFVVPREYPDLRCIGFVQTNSPFFTLLDLTYQLIDEYKVKRSGDFTVQVDVNGDRFSVGHVQVPLFTVSGEQQ